MNQETKINNEMNVCSVCGAKWINSQLYWSTGKPGRNIDLAGLVCNQLKNSAAKNSCINPCQGQVGGDTWDDRIKFLERMEAENGIGPNNLPGGGSLSIKS